MYSHYILDKDGLSLAQTLLKGNQLMEKLILKTILGASFVFASSLSFAATLKASCYLQEADGKQVQGVRQDKIYEIASVSKVITSYWAISKMGVEGRFETKIAVTPVAEDLYDVHLIGSRDPYLGRESLQNIIVNLNQIGVKRVRTLSFDENFKYFDDIRHRMIAQGHFGLNDPAPNVVVRQLQASLSHLHKNYEQTQQKAESIHSMKLPENITFKIGQIITVSSESMKLSTEAKTYIYQSAPLVTLLKEMNRNSNNHAANQIFEALGGHSEFQTFIKEKLNLTEKQLSMVNGSGDRYDLPKGGKVYNSATCQSVVKVIKALQEELSQKAKLGLKDIMAVAGRDVEDENSTVSNIYGATPEIEGAMIAKTGTVNPAVTLAGVVSTQEGMIYFGFIYGTNGSDADWKAGRAKIRTDVAKLIHNHGGKKEIEYSGEAFLPFDQLSTLREAPSTEVLK
ncbi:MAG: hypothetical protein BroJett040_03360 [Oligoflexia bacterium]|nr:MAG: hypothetical protein BroJett040_03360 [Oligoflexia bacterium]